jgi:HSP20 family protein
MANMTRWDPFGEMLTLRDAVNQLFEDSVVNPARVNTGQALAMPLDVSETEDMFIIDAVVPGVKSDDLDITIQDNVLTITAETRHQEQNTDQKVNFHRVERRYGRASRSISLPTPVKADAIEATLDNGILHLEVPKAEEVKPRKISVNTNKPGQSLEVNAQNQ